MRGFFRWTIPVWLVLVSLTGSDLVAEPKASQVDDARSGPCVLLKNDHVLFGVAHQRGEFVVIEKQDGSRIQLERTKVACWASSLRGLYRYRTDNRRSHDAKSHLYEARWCMRHDLPDLATRELQAVYRLDPANREADQIVKQLRRASEKPRMDPTDPAIPGIDGSAVQLASHETTASEETPFDSATLHRFARHVQPLLVNRCGSCHNSESSHGWKIQTPAFGSRPSARITAANLAATMRYVNTSDPQQSELLTRALDGHAGKTLTLGPRAVKPTKSLQWWLRSAQSSSQQKTGGLQALQTPIDADEMRQIGDDDQEPASNVALEEPDDEPKSDGRLPTVKNPFDPEIFNRRFHRE